MTQVVSQNLKAPIHAVHRLHAYRKSLSTKPFGARGKKLIRCELCLLGELFCTCKYRQYLATQVSFMLLMYNDEVLKPTNSGRLIADLIPDTHAFLWTRTDPDQAMFAVLNDDRYQPYLVFPQQYIENQQPIVNQILPHDLGQAQGNKKIPLLIMLDGSWREAIKMYRKSPYLHQMPVLSFAPEALATYALRKGSHDFQLGTAEVASLALTAAQEPQNGVALSAWFDLFVESSLLGRNRRAKETLTPINQYINAFTDALAVSLDQPVSDK
ncbi:DTW domain-containing protein [Shewanella inventionis]|uniref:tRNA-uridine aminocarboxypropyltransferase n=1 Tax=Shewanella inventionis TaxID=1738770 RepID=A0ABQ1J9X6_9GAMM|nr:DTW domain-containing protein [Shewanella inventionis]MCL1157790.1 DTW domain-containing protein [Shewanella inventionis]UAL41643.1 DTW domain-containing protein [Shewanella inventionis]GGB63189.1 DTW domain-containing protein [Shewanella inventionis]